MGKGYTVTQVGTGLEYLVLQSPVTTAQKLAESGGIEPFWERTAPRFGKSQLPVLQNKLHLLQLEIELRLLEHTRSPGEATAAQKLYFELGHVQLVL